MNKIFRYTKFVALAIVAFVAMACNKDNSGMELQDMRAITVNLTTTRTTIGYEGSDVSHLEWVDGDKVAYITDVEGATFATATVSHNKFTANIPSGAENILVLYPVGGNEGKTLAEARAQLSASITQQAGESFNGALLPMYGDATVPAGNSVDLSYISLASVLRLTVLGSEDHATEVLQSVKLKANESVVGDYVLDFTNGGFAIEPASNSVEVNYVGEGEDVLLSKSHDIYMVLFAESFTGVDVEVVTDQNSYFWLDGAMDLSHPERRLYRATLDMAKSEGAPQPEVALYTPVLSIEEVTDDGVYLIAVNIDGKYYVTNNTPTDTANYYWVEGVEVDSTENGVIATDEVANYTWNITKKSGGYEFYSANMLKQGSYGVLLITQGGSGMFGQEDGYEGKAWYVSPATADGYSEAQQSRRYWDIELDGAGKVVLRNKFDRGVGMFPCYKYCSVHGWFTLCFEGGDVEKLDISLLKLR